MQNMHLPGVREPQQKEKIMSSKHPKRPHFLKMRVKAAVAALVRVRRRDARRWLRPRSLHLHLNNKLSVVQFCRRNYRCNHIIVLKTEARSWKNVLSKFELTSLHVCNGVPNGCECLNLKIPVQY